MAAEGDCVMTDTTLQQLIQRFVPASDLYYFEDSQTLSALLQAGVAVYTRQEFSASYPCFSLDYGDVYHVGRLSLADSAWRTLLPAHQLSVLSPTLLEKLLAYQVRCGRGHVYDADWFLEGERPVNTTVTVDGRWFYLLTAADWAQYSMDVRKEWVLKWLSNRHQYDRSTVLDLEPAHERVPYALITEYAGTFAAESGPNCFAATIAMVVGGSGPHHYPQSRCLMAQWLHPEPFFRLLRAQGYVKVTELRKISEGSAVIPSDVLVWYTRDAGVVHAAFAVTHVLVFQKNAQGWDHPWQVLSLADVWYNECLPSGGHIDLYRRV